MTFNWIDLQERWTIELPKDTVVETGFFELSEEHCQLLKETLQVSVELDVPFVLNDVPLIFAKENDIILSINDEDVRKDTAETVSNKIGIALQPGKFFSIRFMKGDFFSSKKHRNGKVY